MPESAIIHENHDALPQRVHRKAVRRAASIVIVFDSANRVARRLYSDPIDLPRA